MPAAAQEEILASLSAEEIFSLAAGVAAALDPRTDGNAHRGQKPHQGIFSKNRTARVSATWVKWSGTHQVIECCASKTVLGPTIYLYDGKNLLEEVDQSGNVLARYTQGASVDEELSELRASTTSYYQVDGLGSITSLSNGTGALAQTYTYDSFGKLTASTGTLTNPFRYTGREFDQETGIYYYRARYYSPQLGRFISEDPSEEGTLGEGTNLYVYVENSPTNFLDPFGLYTLKPGVPPPSAAVAALLECIEALSGVPLVVTSTSDSHSATDPHTRGLAADIRYPSDPAAVLNAAKCCGAQYAQDEKKHPSANATAPHIHVQLVPGKRGGHGDLPANAKCKDCSKD